MNSMKDGRLSTQLRLHQLDHLPPELLETPPSDLWRLLPGPTLIQIPGRRAAPLFVSVLLHGNEVTGWQTMQRILRQFEGRDLPRGLLLFVGNIEAARAGTRTLPHQADYNRSWPGTRNAATPEAELMRGVFDIAKSLAPFASIDIHNNTGRNPHYACVNSFESAHLQLAQLFSRTVVYFERPVGVQSAAMAKICPSTTVECGRPGEAGGVEHAAEFVAAALHLDDFSKHEFRSGELDLMRTFAILRIPARASMSFDGADADFVFRPDLDRLNFSELEAGTPLGRLGRGKLQRIDVVATDAADANHAYVDYEGDTIYLSCRSIPAMLTQDSNAIRQDCLGYLMHRVDRHGRNIDE